MSKPKLRIDEANRVPERTAFCFYGSYFGYPICCQMAFTSRMLGVEDPNAFHLFEGVEFTGSGYVPCRSCYNKPREVIEQEINRFRIHKTPYNHFLSGRDDCDYKLVDKLLFNGMLYENHLKIVRYFAKNDFQGLLRYSEIELGAISKMLDDIASLDKDDRPVKQQAELRNRCVQLTKLRYDLVANIKKNQT